MPKRAHPTSSTASTDCSGCEADYDTSHSPKRHAHSDSRRSLSLLPVDTELDARGSTLLLTSKNLAAHTISTSLQHSQPLQSSLVSGSHILSSLSMSTRSGSPTRNAWDTRATLWAYRIDVDSHHADATKTLDFQHTCAA